jgi:hypothetical protein
MSTKTTLAKYLYFASLAILLSGFYGCSKKNNETKHNEKSELATTYAINKNITYKQFEIKFDYASVSSTLDSQQIIDPKTNRILKFIVVNITAKNNDEKERFLDYGDLRVELNGTVYQFKKSTHTVPDGYALFQLIKPNWSVSGNLVFEMPAGGVGELLDNVNPSIANWSFQNPVPNSLKTVDDVALDYYDEIEKKLPTLGWRNITLDEGVDVYKNKEEAIIIRYRPDSTGLISAVYFLPDAQDVDINLANATDIYTLKEVLRKKGWIKSDEGVSIFVRDARKNALLKQEKVIVVQYSKNNNYQITYAHQYQ